MLPATEVLFAGQGVHATAPRGEYVPSLHDSHWPAPLPLNLPASQSWHTYVVAFSTPENVPFGHALHVPGWPSRGSTSNVPAAHGVHAAAPLPAKKPAPQGAQDPDPRAAAVPAPHVVHDSEPSPE